MGQSKLPKKYLELSFDIYTEDKYQGFILFEIPAHYKGFDLGVQVEAVAGIYFSILSAPDNQELLTALKPFVRQDVIDQLATYGKTLPGNWWAKIDATAYLPESYGSNRVITYWSNPEQMEDAEIIGNTNHIHVSQYLQLLKKDVLL